MEWRDFGGGHGLSQTGQIKEFDPAGRLDGLGRGRRNHSGSSLSARKGRFKIEDGFDSGGVTKNRLD